ncbi:MAG: BlaI/MecI/CopY family transcriptional regulator [bacterium]
MNLKQGHLENIVLNALWNMEENDKLHIDVSDVQNTINSESQKWAYTTIKTVLDRLVEKEEVVRIKLGKKYFYRSKVSRIDAGENAIKMLIKQYFNSDINEFMNASSKMAEAMAVPV